MGFSNGIGTLAGLTCPFVTEMFTARGPQGWISVFLLASLIHFTGITFYAFYASGDLQVRELDNFEMHGVFHVTRNTFQEWAEPKEDEEPWKDTKQKGGMLPTTFLLRYACCI